MRRRAAIAVAEWARINVPLYRELYRGCPPVQDWRDFRRLPVLTSARLRATPVVERIDTPDDTLRTSAPLSLSSLPSAGPVLTDVEDTDATFEEANAAMRALGLRRDQSLAIITDAGQRYAAAELADRLGYYDMRVQMVVAIPGISLDRTFAALAPNQVLTFMTTTPRGHGAAITVHGPAHTKSDLYLAPDAGIVAVRRAGEDSYRVLTGHYLLESGPEGRLLLTSLQRYHQPLVRYLLPDRGQAGRGRLWLEAVAP